jgi:hypothetical protein
MRWKRHGQAGQRPSPEWNAWQGMKGRCYCPNTTQFSRYGGRGITVCDRWRDDFGAFLADMGPKPTPAHELDRIDSDGNYEPNNCRWATRTQQSRNTARNRFIEFLGERLCVAEWAERLGVPYERLLGRLERGWPIEQALMAPFGTIQPRECCKFGHPFTPENTYITPRGFRACRACNVRRTTAYKARKRASRLAAEVPP